MNAHQLRLPAPAVLTREQVDEVFDRAATQQDYLLGLYRLVIPDFDRVEKVHRWPTISQEFWLYICDKAMAWDRAHNVRALHGGAWLNWGFSSDATIKGGRVLPCEVIYKETPDA